MVKRRSVSDIILMILIHLATAVSVFILLGIIGYVFYKGLGQLNWKFLTTVSSVLKGTVGIAGNIVNTLYMLHLD